MTKQKADKTLPDFFHSKLPIICNFNPQKYNDKHYWMLTVRDQTSVPPEKQPSSSTYLPPYQDNEDGMIECGDVDDSYEITQTKSGKYLTSFYVPGPLQSVIIGPRGQKLKALQQRTNTQIKVPRINEIGNVEITGRTERSVASARSQVAMCVLNKREKMPVTHFLSVPIRSDEITENFNKFKNEILQGAPVRGVTESVFQNRSKLHLTIGVLTLLDEAEIEAVKKLMFSCYTDVILPIFSKRKKHYIILKGVEIMNDDPGEVSVLYAKVQMQTEEETNLFQTMCNDIVQYLFKKGFVKNQYERVKLHVTLMNAAFNKTVDEYDRVQPGNQKRETFHASFILDKYKEFYFGKSLFEDLHLSVRFSGTPGSYYTSALTIPIL